MSQSTIPNNEYAVKCISTNDAPTTAPTDIASTNAEAHHLARAAQKKIAAKNAPSALLSAALKYAADGWRILPCWWVTEKGTCACGDDKCRSQGKHPIVFHGVDDASNDPETIRQWWEKHPQANIGGTGYVVIDIDGGTKKRKDGTPKDGIASLAKLEEKHGALPLTRTHKSGSGMPHLIFRRIEGVGNGTDAFGEEFAGVDIKADGGYVMLPPSNHVLGSYTVTDGAPIAELPPAWREALLSRDRKKPTTSKPAAAPSVVSEDDRQWAYKKVLKICEKIAASKDSTLDWAKGQWQAAGGYSWALGEETIASQLLAATAVRGGGVSDIERQVGNLMRIGADKPLLPPRRPKNLGVLCGASPSKGRVRNDDGDTDDGDSDDGDSDDTDDNAPRKPGEGLWELGLLELKRDGKNDNPTACVANVATILESREEWNDILAVDERTRTANFQKPPPWGKIHDSETFPRPIDTADGVRLAQWFVNLANMGVSAENCVTAMMAVAKRRRLDPVRDYLLGLPSWDGVPRAETWLIDYAGVADTPYTRAVSKKWLISAVARALQPGSKVDTLLVLEGEQGLKKSTLFETLAGPKYFFDGKLDVGNKDTLITLTKCWIVELAELSAMSGRSVEQVKSFLTTKVDDFRSPYERQNAEWPRRCVFAGTTNASEYLKDPTGARRFWVARCTKEIDIDGVRAVRDQLWAEAVARFTAWEEWWLTDEEAKLAAVQQEDRYEIDEIESRIATALEKGVRERGAAPSTHSYAIQPKCGAITVDDILRHVCDDRGQADRSLQTRIGNALNRLGWPSERKRLAPGGPQVKVYRRPTAPPN